MTEPKKELSREEVFKWYNDQIELAKVRAELAELNARAVKAEAERMQAAMFMAQMEAANLQSEKPNPDGQVETNPSEKPQN